MANPARPPKHQKLDWSFDVYKREYPNEKRDVYAKVTYQIINAIEQGTDVVPSPALPPLDQVREFIRASKAENTVRGYNSDWLAFCAWTDARRLCAMPASPETVAAFIAESAGRVKVGSVQRRLNAITEAHKTLGLEPPTHPRL